MNVSSILLLLVFWVMCDIPLIYLRLAIMDIAVFLYLTWPLSIYLIWRLWTTTKRLRIYRFFFAATMILFTFLSYMLALDKPGGIVFDPNPLLNMFNLTVLLLIESGFLLIWDLRSHGKTKDAGLRFVAFSSSIPWISPFIIEITFLVRWYVEGNILIKTAGMSLGGLFPQDVLFSFGFLNFITSFLVFLAFAYRLWLRDKRRRVSSSNRSGMTEKEHDKQVWTKSIEVPLPSFAQHLLKVTTSQLSKRKVSEQLKSRYV